MIRYFSKALGAHFRAGKSLSVLTVFGVALGVASVLSIQIINRNALAAFEGSVTAVSGESKEFEDECAFWTQLDWWSKHVGKKL